MFRRRAPSNPAHKTPPSASASLAATKAFVRDRESNASLSSAAAAAALRTHATEPTQVGDTVTKRMARRQSLSSQGSGSQRPGPMRRHSSSGSMTERSFRAPSPRNSPVPSHDDAPPVPSVPKDVPAASAVHRRASSLEPPYRNASPVGRGGGRGLSLDRANPAPQRGQGHGARAASLSQVVEHDNDDNNSPRSINFSRPISPQQTAAPPIRTASQRGNSGWFSGPVVNPEATFRGTKTKPKIQQGVTGYDLHNAQQSVQNAVDRPVKKNQLAHGVEGMRLSSGSMRAKPTGTAVQQRQPQPAPTAAPERPRPVDPKSPYAVYDPSSRTFIHKQDAMALHRQLSQEDAASSHDYVTQHMTRPHEYASPQQPKPARNVAQSPPSRAQYVEREPSPLRQEHSRSLSPSVEEEEPEEPEEVEMRPPTPPSVSHSPAGAILPRQGSEEFGGLDIKSLDEGRSPRKIDTAVANAVREATDSPVSPKQVPTQDGPYPRLGTPINLEPLRSGQGRGGVRTHSLSPPRNAHFAAVAVELQSGIRHQPPPRSVSPAKSALKSSPSVSRRSSSPVNDGRVYGRTEPSEASDTMSEDGTRRKKKNVRVSFDEDAVIAGVSAYPEAEAQTSSTGLGASRWSTNNQQDLDDVLKPRPVLPSFGSIRSRNKRQESAGDVPEKVTETVSSSLSASVASMGEPLESSSDHALAGILAQDFAEKKPAKDSSNEPLPPEVTSVEGTGYNSESDSSDIFESASPESQRSDITKDRELPTPEPEPKSLTTPEHKPLAPEVPTIAVQPASPSPLVEKPEPMYLPPSLPGGWDEEESDQEVKEKVEDKNITQPVPSPAHTKVETQPPVAQPQAKDEDSSDDDSSIYSDAYEELTDNEDDGFGSIDAVVESPSVGPSSGMMFSNHADKLVEPTQSALRNEYLEEARQPSTSADLDATRQHWNDVHDARKQQKHEGSVEESPAVATPKRKPSKKSKERKAKSNTVTATAAAPAPAPRQPETPVQPRKSAMKKASPSPQAPTTPQFRKSMRSGTDQERPPSSGQMKKTMRSTTPQATPETHMRKSMRGSEPAGEARGPSGLAASRYSMPPPESKQPKGALQKKHIPATSAPKPRPQSMSAAAHASRPPAPPPAPKYDSDSDASASSFQRSRPRASRRQDSGRYTMRASMRSGPTPSMRPAPTMRPISPLEPSSPPATALRKSMRPSSPPTESAAMRSSKFSIRSLSPAGRFRSTKSSISGPPAPPSTPKKTSSKMPSFGKPKSKPEAEAPSKSRFKSRFADSSDEEEDEERPKRFQSRFADSDEEDNYQLPPGLAPVRGIPRKPGEEDGDSTDLEEELSDNEPPTPKAKEVEKNGRPTNGVTNGHSVNFAAEPLQKSKHAPELPSFESGKKKSKRGFFGLGKKKKKTSYIEDEPTPPAKASLDIPLPPEPHNKDRTLTPINEDKEVEAKQSAVTRSPKLQRRSLQHRSTSDSSWPLAEPPKIGEGERPQSSDGLPSRRLSLRPTLSKRHSSQVSEAKTAPDSRPDKDVGVVGRAGTKKKKFQGLRRVFGLND
ncbi:hypothetical protein BS50DRAFT_218809 [Corynespora cassiicola Philippines]|uniref:Uncharacterized protein n=1 Tax=Corynespora cassiicola Philippines TaxID=1448308 RepID=A0A2T2N3W3_CORCC|nr:hypothetical protein BS50DRAFT_218809 [Corynespora cassiicola Philippines]